MKKKLYLILLFLLLGNAVPISATDNIPITVDSTIQNGTIELSATSGMEGDTITVIPKPNAGYRLKDGSLKYKVINGDFEISNSSFTVPTLNTIIYKSNLPVSMANTFNRGNIPVPLTDEKIPVFLGQVFQIGVNGSTYSTDSLWYSVYDKNDNQLYTNSAGNAFFPKEQTIQDSNASYIRIGSFDEKNGHALYLKGFFQSSIVIENIQISAEFEPVNVNYQVNHYIENFDDSYSLIESETKSALTDSSINTNTYVKQIEGFTLNKATN